MSRLLANKRFVISERGGVPEEEAYFSAGVVFVARSEIRAACLHYLERPEERRRIAEEGHRLFRMRDEVGVLREPVLRLLPTLVNPTDVAERPSATQM